MRVLVVSGSGFISAAEMESYISSVFRVLYEVGCQ
jgi:hypothetical protein